MKECVIQADEKQSDYDLSKIRTMLERCGVILTEIKSSYFNSKNIEQDLNRLLTSKYTVQSLRESCIIYSLPA